MIQICNNMKKLVRFWEKSSKSKQPSSKCFAYVQTSVKDPMTAEKLSAALQPFRYNHVWQWIKLNGQWFHKHYTYVDWKELVTKALSFFVKPVVIQGCIGGSDLEIRKKVC